MELAQPAQLSSIFGSLHGTRAAMLSTGTHTANMRIAAQLPPLRSATDSLQYLQRVVLLAPAAGRKLQLASRQALPALAGPAAANSGKAEVAADGILGLLRVAAAEVHGLSCSSVMLDPISCLPGDRQHSSFSRVEPPAIADGHGAACSAGAWSAPRLLQAAASTPSGFSGLFGQGQRSRLRPQVHLAGIAT